MVYGFKEHSKIYLVFYTGRYTNTNIRFSELNQPSSNTILPLTWCQVIWYVWMALNCFRNQRL